MGNLRKQTELELWLRSLKATSSKEIDGDEADALLSLPGEKGFDAFIRIIYSTREQLLMQLTNLPLRNETERYMAGVTQGQIRALDNLLSSLVQQGIPSADDEMER